MSRQIHLYDTTLRDGMQGEGMSLSAGREAARRARARRARDPLHRGRLPQLEPEGGGAVRAARAASSFENAEICAFGMTRRRDLAAAEDPALTLLASCFAPVCTLVGKTWKLHLEKVIHTDPQENLELIARLGRLPGGAGQARDLRRRALLRRLPRRPRLRPALPRGGARRGRGERDALRHERLQPARRRWREAVARPSWSASAASGSASTPTTTPSAASRTRSPRWSRAPVARPGHDERPRRALRQREPGLDPARRCS